MILLIALTVGLPLLFLRDLYWASRLYPRVFWRGMVLLLSTPILLADGFHTSQWTQTIHTTVWWVIFIGCAIELAVVGYRVTHQLNNLLDGIFRPRLPTNYVHVDHYHEAPR